MRINGIPNKFEVFQDYYYEVNGQKISYTDACNLYGKMEADEKSLFEQYYKDETGYEIIAFCSPKANPNVGEPVDTGKTKTVRKKKVGPDGSITYEEKDIKVYRFDRTIVTGTTTDPTTGETIETTKTIEGYRAQSVKNAINVKYSLEAFAKEIGMIIDPEWAVYSAEEIIQMENEGVNIPQDVLDIAHSIYEASSANYEGSEDAEDGEETTEKEPFLDLIPKAEKKIKKCEENSDKIEDKVEELLPEQNKRKSKLENTLKDQQASLKEFEDFIREWRHLQDKVNNGEVLTDREAARYAELTGMLNDPLSGKSNFEIDKREIAKSLNEINILAVLGEDLADETIEIAETLSDYTSKSNYKTTAKEVAGAIGPLAMILAMVKGKYIADMAAQVGNDTKEYTEESHKSVLEIANILDIESSIANTSAVQESEASQAQQNQADAVTDQTEPTNVGSEEEVQPDATGEGSTESSTEGTDIEDDFILNNDSVKELIEQASDINIDLSKQIFNSIKSIAMANEDKKFAEKAEQKIDKLIAEFAQEEEERQIRIQTLEEENKKAKDELENLTGVPADEQTSETNTEDEEEPTDKSDREKITELREKIISNNKEIESIRIETESSKAEFVSATVGEKEVLSKSIPAETEALANDTEYQEEIIPEDKKVLNLTEASGMTLAKIGEFQTELGIMQMMAFLYTIGMLNITGGAIKMGLGFTAVATSDTPIPAAAEKSTKKAVKEEGQALTALTNVDEKIAEQTGEESISAGLAQQNAEGTEEGATEGTENGENPEQGAVDGAAEGTENGENPEQGAVDGAVEGTAEGPDNITRKKSGSKKDEAMDADTDKAQEIVDDAAASGKEDSKESVELKKDTEKDEKKLVKEAKKLQKRMIADQKELVKLTKDSEQIAKKQQELLVEYEGLVAENETMIAEDQQNQANQPQPAQQDNQNGQAGFLVQNAFMAGAAQVGNTGNADKITQNDARLNELGITFSTYGKKLNRNHKQMIRIQKQTKLTDKKFTKKCKQKDKIHKENEKKELEKQKRLQKQLAIVGIQENIFSIVTAVGTILSMIPYTAAIGAVMVDVGTYGTIACGVTKGIINIANGNLTAGLVAIGQAVITAAASMVGAGSAASAATSAAATGIQTASQGLQVASSALQVVSSSADMVNNVRTVQGKEASGVASKISAIAGAASAVTGAVSNSADAKGTVGIAVAVGQGVGAALSATSQVMSAFGNDSKATEILGMIGAGISSVSTLASNVNNKMNAAKNKNDDNKTTATSGDGAEGQDGTDKGTDTKGVDGKGDAGKNDATKSDADKGDNSKTDGQKDDPLALTLNTTANVPDNPQLQSNVQAQVDQQVTQVAQDEAANIGSMQDLQAQNTDNQQQTQQLAESTDAPADKIDTSDMPLELKTQVTEADLLSADAAAAKINDSVKQNAAAAAAKQAAKQAKMDLIKQVLQGVGSLAQTVIPMVMSQNGQANTGSKKPVPPGKLTERTKQIIAKNRKRIQALTVMAMQRSQRQYA